jgi:hypothetical protein
MTWADGPRGVPAFLLRGPHFVAVILVCAAIACCRYYPHAADAAEGIVAAGVLIPVGNRLYLRLGSPASPSPE